MSKPDTMASFFYRPYLLTISCLFVAVYMGLYLTWIVFNEPSDKPIILSSIVPEDVVKGWSKTFPHTPLLAASLTTKHFRDGRSHEAWVSDMRDSWARLQFQYRTGQVKSGWTEGNMAHIIYHATGSSIWGEHERQEEYLLIRTPEGRWLINDIRLIQEQVM